MDLDDSDSEWGSISSCDSDETETTEEQSVTSEEESVTSDEYLPPDVSSESDSEISQTPPEAYTAQTSPSTSLSSTQVDSCEYSLYSSTAFSVNTFGSDISEATRDIRCDILAKWLHARQIEKMWTGGSPGEGVFVKKSRGNYAYAPPTLCLDGADICHGIMQLNVRVCGTSRNWPFVHY